MQKYKVMSKITEYWYGTKREVIDYMKRVIRADQANAVYDAFPCNEYRQITGSSIDVRLWYYEAIDEIEAEKK